MPRFRCEPRRDRTVIEDTKRFWEERTYSPISEEDAREAVRSITSFFDLLAAWDSAEKTAGEEAGGRP